ncbi:MAG: PH domain-containing protein [Ignavibacteriaceae bacterium]
MKFESKKDLLFTLIIACIPVVSIWALVAQPVFIGWVYLALSLLFPVWVWKSTYYEISDGYLTARIMFLKTKLKISDINLVRETENIWSSYALSLKRLEVKSKWNVIYISPLDKEGFIKELKSYNPDIKVV